MVIKRYRRTNNRPVSPACETFSFLKRRSRRGLASRLRSDHHLQAAVSTSQQEEPRTRSSTREAVKFESDLSVRQPHDV